MYQGRYENRKPQRRRKLNKYFLVTLSLILLLGAAVGSTIAYIIASGGTVTNSFTPGVVLCEVKADNSVENTGNVDAYIRAAVVINWENASGDINGIAPKADTDYTVTLGENWVKIGEYYYYKNEVPFQGTDKTTPVVTVKQLTKSPEGFSLMVEVLAEAIQAEGTNGTETPIEDAWDVAMPLGGNG